MMRDEDESTQKGFWSGLISRPWLIIYVAIISVVVLTALLILGLSMCGGPKEEPEETKQSKRDAYRDYLEFADVQIDDMGLDAKLLSGAIKNTGAKTVRKIEITISYLDEAGKAVYERTYYPVLASQWETDEGKLLKPNSSRRFQYKLDYFPAGWSGKMDLKIAKIAFIYELW